jgi:hypothetical protein
MGAYLVERVLEHCEFGLFAIEYARLGIAGARVELIDRELELLYMVIGIYDLLLSRIELVVGKFQLRVEQVALVLALTHTAHEGVKFFLYLHQSLLLVYVVEFFFLESCLGSFDGGFQFELFVILYLPFGLEVFEAQLVLLQGELSEYERQIFVFIFQLVELLGLSRLFLQRLELRLYLKQQVLDTLQISISRFEFIYRLLFALLVF